MIHYNWTYYFKWNLILKYSCLSFRKSYMIKYLEILLRRKIDILFLLAINLWTGTMFRKIIKALFLPIFKWIWALDVNWNGRYLKLLCHNSELDCNYIITRSFQLRTRPQGQLGLLMMCRWHRANILHSS